MFVIMGVHYIEVFSIHFTVTGLNNNYRSSYQGLRYIGVCYIRVTLYNVTVFSLNLNRCTVNDLKNALGIC